MVYYLDENGEVRAFNSDSSPNILDSYIRITDADVETALSAVSRGDMLSYNDKGQLIVTALTTYIIGTEGTSTCRLVKSITPPELTETELIMQGEYPTNGLAYLAKKVGNKNKWVRKVPLKLTAHQVKVAMVDFMIKVEGKDVSLFSVVNSFMGTLAKSTNPTHIKILLAWQTANDFERNSPIILSLLSEFGLTAEDVEKIFLAAELVGTGIVEESEVEEPEDKVEEPEDKVEEETK